MPLRLPPSVLLLLLLSPLLPGLLAGCTEAGDAHAPGPLAPEAPSEPRIRGVTLDARHPPDSSLLPALQALGVTHVAVIPFGFQARHDVPELRHNPSPRWYSESDAGIRALAREAEALGMAVLVKPQLWLGRHDTAGRSPADIGFRTEADWQAWEARYRAFILHYARLSEEIGAPLLCIGTELAQAARTRPAFWKRLIADVREVYGGQLTYAANWYEEYEHLTFWEDLDFIGVQAYFPLHRGADPSLDALRKGWEPHLQALERLHRQTGRPVLFTEIGYRSVGYAAAEPWRWPARDEADRTPPDPDLQARLYQAFFERVWGQPWFAGAIVWKWYPAADARHALDFTPQDKPAAAVIDRWFNAAGAAP